MLKDNNDKKSDMFFKISFNWNEKKLKIGKNDKIENFEKNDEDKIDLLI